MDSRALIAAALLLLAAGCQGPRPSVSEAHVAPSPLAGRYRVDAVVANRSRGEGEVDVHMQLRDRKSGRIIEAERDLELHGHEQAHFTADVEAPAGDYEVKVEAKYPPE